jgi:pimeloyl-ACP methyl ester carboxylesterase
VNVVVDQLLTNYQLSGSGEDKLILLLHGWGDAAKGLAALQKELSHKYRVLTPDLPGFGGTQAPAEAWDLDNYAQYLQNLLKKLGLDQPYAVIGHSNGGALAIRSISLGKLQPTKLILLAASGSRAKNSSKRLLLNIIAKAGNLATIWMPARYRQALRKSLYGAAGSDMLVAPQLQNTFKKIVRQDVQADAAALNIPTLLIYAAVDKAVPLTDGQNYQSLIKNSRLEVIQAAGHFLHLDQPAEVNKLIEDFLA